MNKNEIVKLQIVDISSAGMGVGKIDGIPVFVSETALGDIIEAKIIKVKKSYLIGKLQSIISPSQDRIEKDCPYFPKCGGCAYRHISYEAEKRIKENNVYNNIKRIGGIDLAPQKIVGETFSRYRNKAQYPIGLDGKAGFYSAHSHRVVASGDCLLQPQEFSKAKEAFEEWIRKSGVGIYNEETKEGLCRHLYLRKGFKSGEIMAVAVVNGKDIPAKELLVSLLREALGDDLKSICFNINTKDNNVVLGEENIVLYGTESIEDTLCDVRVQISPNSFYQVNRDMAEKLYQKAAQYAKPQGKTVLDLYCGAGTIGLSMSKQAQKIIGIEIVEDAVKDAFLNAKNQGIKNAEFICADAFLGAKELKKRGIKPHVVILDPPRKGCDKELLETVAKTFAPERIVYVSCDSATLARDIAALDELGYKLIEYTPFDLFPRTIHCETVALLSRQNKFII